MYSELGTPTTHTQQAGPSQGQAAWDYLWVDFVFKSMHGFIDERFMHNVLNNLTNILYSWVELDVFIALW